MLFCEVMSFLDHNIVDLVQCTSSCIINRYLMFFEAFEVFAVGFRLLASVSLQ